MKDLESDVDRLITHLRNAIRDVNWLARKCAQLDRAEAGEQAENVEKLS